MKTIIAVLFLSLSGCMTVGYHYAKDPLMVAKYDVTVLSIKPQKIRSSVGVALVGPLAKVNAIGWKVKFVDAAGKTFDIVQPRSDQYEITVGQQAYYVINRGQVWVQPKDYPLPPGL